MAYSKDAVDKAIASSNRSGRKIGGNEAKAVHSLLRGGHEYGSNHSLEVKPSSSEMAHHFHEAGCSCGKCA